MILDERRKERGKKATTTVKGRYLVNLVLAAILAVGLLMLTQPTQAQAQADEEQSEVGTATHGIEDISIDKSARAQVKKGRLVTYNLTVRHNDPASPLGSNISGHLRVTDALPQGMQFVSVLSSLQNNSGLSANFSCSGGATVICESNPGLFNADVATISIVARAMTRGVKVNTASVQLLDPSASDPNLSNNSDAAATRVLRSR
jgi:hypothetical protein